MLTRSWRARDPQSQSANTLTRVAINTQRLTPRVVAKVADYLCEELPNGIVHDVQAWKCRRKPRGVVVRHSTDLPRSQVVRMVQQALRA